MTLAGLFLPLFLQVGPAPTTSPVTAVPEELYEQRRLNNARERAKVTVQETDPVQQCFERADTDPEAARLESRERFDQSTGIDRAIAGHCLGYALSNLDRWSEAAEAFGRAKDVVPADNPGYRTRLGAATAAARLAAGEPEAALIELSALDAGDNSQLASRIALDRARASVALDRAGEAELALDAARTADADNAEAWLLSATLARRLGKLDEARTYIERAAILRPYGSEIGLEAGVIAVLSGDDDTARRNWQSVVETAPESPAALTAAGYLAQLRGE